jgi:hypothetical protein
MTTAPGADEPTVDNETRTYTITYGDAVIELTQAEMDRFIDAAGDVPPEPDETDERHPLARSEDGPDVITVTTSDGTPFSYHGQRLPQAAASWVFSHALSQAIHTFGMRIPRTKDDLLGASETTPDTDDQ